jgi:hypothetical protein
VVCRSVIAAILWRQPCEITPVAKRVPNRYAALMDHYDCEAERTNARCANENGDVESSNGHLKDRIEQALLLRGSRNFESREEYVQFVEQLVTRANGNRQNKYSDDLAHLNRLPAEQLDTDDLMLGVKVSRSSTIRIRIKHVFRPQSADRQSRRCSHRC